MGEWGGWSGVGCVGLNTSLLPRFLGQHGGFGVLLCLSCHTQNDLTSAPAQPPPLQPRPSPNHPTGRPPYRPRRPTHIQSTCPSMHMRGQAWPGRHTHDTQCGWDGVKPASAWERVGGWRVVRNRLLGVRNGNVEGQWGGSRRQAGCEGEEAILS